MNELPLDIRYYIATLVAQISYKTYIRLLLIDARFRTFIWKNPKQVSLSFKIMTYEDGMSTTTLFDRLHSFDDEPAIIYANGTRVWCDNNEYHRDNDKPAIIYANGTQEWWINNERIK